MRGLYILVGIVVIILIIAIIWGVVVNNNSDSGTVTIVPPVQKTNSPTVEVVDTGEKTPCYYSKDRSSCRCSPLRGSEELKFKVKKGHKANYRIKGLKLDSKHLDEKT